MNRRSLLGKLFAGAASAVVVPLSLVDGKQKFVVPEKAVASSVPVPKVLADSMADGIETWMTRCAAAEAGYVVFDGSMSIEDKHAAIKESVEKKLEKPPYVGPLAENEVVYTFLGTPCVLKSWELGNTGSNEQMVSAVLKGIASAAERGITAETPQRSGWRGAVMIDPWPNADLLLKRAEAVRAEQNKDELPFPRLVKNASHPGVLFPRTYLPSTKGVPCSV